MAASDASWKLAEYERHFNIIQAGLRGIASIWLLAAFGAIASVLTHEDANHLVVPLELATAAIAAMGSIGLTVLWMQDELIYHRLLNAILLLGLRLEDSNPQLPPIHAAMYSSMPKRGYEKQLSTFYNIPIGVLGLASLVAFCAAVVSTIRGSGEIWNGGAVLVLTAVPLALFFHVRAKSDDERAFFAEQARRYNDSSFDLYFPFPHDARVKPESNDADISRVLAAYRPRSASEMGSESAPDD
jgi:hypothetical protein